MDRNKENLKSAIVRKNARIIELEASLKKTAFYLYAVASNEGKLKTWYEFENDFALAQTPETIITEARELLA